MTDAPPALLVDADLDTVRIHLGPSHHNMAYRSVAVWVGTWFASAGLFLLGMPDLALAAALIGAGAGGLFRLLEWRRREAPLELWVSAHSLELRRVYRDRLLHTERLDLSDLTACKPLWRGLLLVSKDGSVRALIAGYRSVQEIQWVADHLQARITALTDGEPDPRLVALRARDTGGAHPE